jgi:uncharacterized cupredoxin-like copper-binding protein
MIRERTSVALIAVGALVLAGCGGDAETDPTTELTVAGTNDLTFEPDTWTVPTGEEITVELSADGVEHDFVIEGGVDVAEAGEEGHGDEDDDMDGGENGEMDTEEGDLHVAHADAGETVTSTMTVHEAGTYEVYCSVPGHRDAGMIGTLTAVSPD